MRFILILLLSCLALSARAQDVCSENGYYWFVSAEAVRKLLRQDERNVKSVFDTCKTVIGGGSNIASERYDLGLRARKRLIYQSYREFESEVRAGRIPAEVKIVVYNPEPGHAGTEMADKADPIGNGRRFADLARKNGLMSVAAPSCRLIKEPRDLTAKFMACGDRLLAPMAANFDFVDIQAQAFQSNPSVYRQIVTNAARQMKRVNPRVWVIAQVTTADAFSGTAEVMAVAADSVADEVDGYWLNLESKQGGLQDAAGLLQGPLKQLNERGLRARRVPAR